MAKKKALPLSKVYGLLEPGPVVLVSTSHKGRHNVMPMSWHMMMEFEPPLIGCILSGRNYSFEALRKTKQCVINIPTTKILEKVVACGNVSGRDTDKFSAFGLTAITGSVVEAPFVEECYANFECTVADTKMVDKYNMFVLEVKKAWVDPAIRDPKTIHHRGMGVFMTAGKSVRKRSRAK